MTSPAVVIERTGILSLRVGGAGRCETKVWIEPTENVRARLREILYRQQEDRRLS